MKVGRCPICGGDTKEAIVEVQETIEEQVYIIKGVNAEVCVQCGERMYSLDEMRRIENVREKIKNKIIKPIEVRKVAVVSL
jgi:YgiT-type zinc finger domain-containing protein